MVRTGSNPVWARMPYSPTSVVANGIELGDSVFENPAEELSISRSSLCRVPLTLGKKFFKEHFVFLLK